MKAAYVDHDYPVYASPDLLIAALEKRGVEVCARQFLDEMYFPHEPTLDSFPVLLYHPGITEQHFIRGLREKRPNLSIAIITGPIFSGEYGDQEVPIFDYIDVNRIVDFIRENQ